MKKRTGRVRTVFGAVILAGFSLLLATCGQDNEQCYIDCQDVTVPESRGRWQLEDQPCDQCKEKFFIIREVICGGGGNPNCICSYLCEGLWEFRH